MAELQNKLKMAKEKVEIGKKYAHYRSKEKAYLVLQVALLEHDLEPCVVYQDSTDSSLVWVRPLASFCEKVNHDGKMVPRFEKIA